MLEAHARRLVDFRTFRPFDRRWWLKLIWAMDWLETERYAKVWEADYALNLAVLDYNTDDKVFDLHWKQAGRLRTKLLKQSLPWLKIPESAGVSDIRSLSDQWKKVWGDPDDPRTAAIISATVNALQERANKNRRFSPIVH